MKIENTEVYGFEPAFRGMRNPLNSWDKSDSRSYCVLLKDTDLFPTKIYKLGENDLKLAQNLILAGTEHCKFLRMIQVWVDITMPRYWWSEFDTYKFTEKNSCSTMHKLFDKNSLITIDMFEYDEHDTEAIKNIIQKLNVLRKLYFETQTQLGKDYILKRAKTILPEGYLQKRTVNTNYAELRNIYRQRHNHRLTEEWQDTFCEWIKTLPYADELITNI